MVEGLLLPKNEHTSCEGCALCKQQRE